MKRPVRLLAVIGVLAAVLAPTALGADRMWVGFHDDPVLRYGEQRHAEMDMASRTNNAKVVRTLVNWHQIAPDRPANAANPFDPAYNFDDLDEFVRNAQVRDMEVVMAIWGTPSWANGGKKPQFLPTRMSDFQNFARALASRYSGRTPGLPFVRFFGIWNESNLGLFLLPQFNAAGKIVSPAAYAKLAAAGYAGIKAGSKKALVGIGETSSTGRDKKSQRNRRGRAGHVHEGDRRGEQAPQVRRVGTAPVPAAREHEADAEGAVPERHSDVPPAVREGPRQGIRPQEHPDLDHRVRP